jgi:radical SAM protein with 4Fe4S-binding SPASM domain
MSIFDRIKDALTPAQPVPQGIYHYRSAPEEVSQYRLHLRVNPDGKGILVVNASTVLHLNETAVYHARLLIDRVDPVESGRILAKRYRVDPAVAERDARRLRDTIADFVNTKDLCPVTYLDDLQKVEPFQAPLAAPYRVDLALTYRCDNNCAHCYVARPRDTSEMTTDQWRAAMAKLWDAGVPHLCFTGGEATLREDLEELIIHAEDIGFVTGLLTNGRRLSDRPYLDSLVAAGLDHVQITLESHDEAVHNKMVGAPAWKETVAAVRNSVDADLHTITNTTLTRANVAGIGQTVDFIASLGAQSFACNGLIYSGQGKQYDLAIPESELAEVLDVVAEAAERNGLRFIWYTPTQYCHLNPMELELGIKSCTAAKYNLCIEPDGQVIPCQSYYRSLGSIMTDGWESIWNHPVAQSLREKESLPPACKECEQLNLCGGGCPIYREAQAEQGESLGRDV